MVLWLGLVLGASASEPIDQLVRCGEAKQLLPVIDELDSRIDPDGPVEVQLVDHRVVATRFRHRREGRAATLAAYGHELRGDEVVPTADEASVPVAVDGSMFTIGVLRKPDDPLLAKAESLRGCVFWEAEPRSMAQLFADSSTARFWLGTEAAATLFRLSPTTLAVAAPPAAMTVPRLTSPAGVVRFNLSTRPDATLPEGELGLADMSMFDLVLPLVRGCEPWTSGAYVLMGQGGLLMHCPHPRGQDVVDAMVDDINDGPFDVAKEVDGVWDLGMRMFGRYAVADASGYWIGDDLDLIADARDASGQPAWGPWADEPGVVLDSDGVRIHLTARDGLVHSHLHYAVGTQLAGALPAVLKLDELLPAPPAPVVAGAEVRVVRAADPCDGRDLRRCAQSAAQAMRNNTQLDKARTWAGLACDGDVGQGCYLHGALLADGLGGDEDEVRALTSFERGCELEFAGACWAAGKLYRKNADRARSDARHTKACDLGADRSCYVSAWALVADGASPTSDRVLGLLRRSCNAGEYLQCLNAAEGFLVRGEPERTSELLDTRMRERLTVDQVFIREMLKLQTCDTPACVASVARAWAWLPDEPELGWRWTEVQQWLPDDDRGRAMSELLEVSRHTPRDSEGDGRFYDALAALQPADAARHVEIPEPKTPVHVDGCVDDYIEPTLVTGHGWGLKHYGDGAGVFIRDKVLRALPDPLSKRVVVFCGVQQSDPAVLAELVEGVRHSLAVSGKMSRHAGILAEFGGDQLFVNSTDLNASAVRTLAAFEGTVLSLSGVDSIDVDTAKQLAARSEDDPTVASSRRSENMWDQSRLGRYVLHIGGLNSISTEVADILATYKGGELGLRGLPSIDADVARALAAYRGMVLDLSGLQSITPDVAAQLATARVERLRLDGITRLTPEVARALGHFKHVSLSLRGVTELDAETAAALVQDRPRGSTGAFELHGLRELTPEVARALSDRSVYHLELPGVTSLDGPTAEVLFDEDGPKPDLDGLRSLTPDAAHILADRDHWSVRLPSIESLDVELVRAIRRPRAQYFVFGGVRELSVEVAALLCLEPTASLDFWSVEELDLPTARVLGSCASEELSFPGLVRMGPEVAQALTRFFPGKLLLPRHPDYGAATNAVLQQAATRIEFRATAD